MSEEVKLFLSLMCKKKVDSYTIVNNTGDIYPNGGSMFVSITFEDGKSTAVKFKEVK